MKTLVARKSLTLLVAFLFMSLLTTGIAEAQPNGNANGNRARASEGLLVPVVGTFTDATGGTGRFVGNFNLLRFAEENNQIVAVGILTGTLTDSANNPLGTVLRTVAIPVNLQGGSATDQIACDILNLDLGPLDLNLLGLRVQLSRIELDITAVPGAGNLLGNLLCAIVNLLNGPGPLSAIISLLNQLLGALGGLGV